jgi:hypothetical protein
MDVGYCLVEVNNCEPSLKEYPSRGISGHGGKKDKLMARPIKTTD